MADKDLSARYASYVKSRDSFMQDKAQVEAELGARKRALKTAMDEAVQEGFDPSNLDDEIRKLEEIITTKLSVLERDLEDANRALQPMLAEIRK